MEDRSDLIEDRQVELLRALHEFFARLFLDTDQFVTIKPTEARNSTHKVKFGPSLFDGFVRPELLAFFVAA